MQPTLEQTVYKAAWRIIPIVALGSIINFIDSVNLGFAGLTMNHDLGFNPAVFGFAAGMSFLGLFVFEVPSNLILEKVGARRWFARIMISWGLVAGATAFVSTAFQLDIVRFLLGMAEGGFNPGVVFFFTLWFPKQYRIKMFSYFMLARPIAPVIGGPLSAAILGMDGVLGLHGWQWLFLIEAAPAVILGIVIYFWLPSDPNDAPWFSPEERNTLNSALTAERAEIEKSGTGLASLWRTVINGRVWALTLAYCGFAACWWTVVYFMPQIVKATGATNQMAALLSAIPFAVGALAIFVTGFLGHRIKRIELWIFVTSLTVAVGLAGTAYLGTSPWSLAPLIIATAGGQSFLLLFWTLMPRFLVGTAAAGGLAFVNAIGLLGGFIGPSVYGWVANETGGFSTATAIFAGVAAVCSLSLLFSAKIGGPAPAVAHPVKVSMA